MFQVGATGIEEEEEVHQVIRQFTEQWRQEKTK
jgi:hypothetical protein